MISDTISKSYIDAIVTSLKDLEDKDSLVIKKKECLIIRLEEVRNGVPQIFEKEELIFIRKYLVGVYAALLKSTQPIHHGLSKNLWNEVDKDFERWIYETEDNEFQISLKSKK